MLDLVFRIVLHHLLGEGRVGLDRAETLVRGLVVVTSDLDLRNLEGMMTS